MSLPTIVVPGDRICSSAEAVAGPGSYLLDNSIYASVAGKVLLKDTREVTVQGKRAQQGLVPQVGDIVICRVNRVAQRVANLEIMCLGSTALDGNFSGLLRQEHVRATEIDKVEMTKCFRPGDVVRCRVLSLGDARSFYLTTASNELGVVYARSQVSGEPMEAISWEEMVCPVTGSVEKRKCAADPGTAGATAGA